MAKFAYTYLCNTYISRSAFLLLFFSPPPPSSMPFGKKTKKSTTSDASESYDGGEKNLPEQAAIMEQKPESETISSEGLPGKAELIQSADEGSSSETPADNNKHEDDPMAKIHERQERFKALQSRAVSSHFLFSFLTNTR